MEIKNLVTISLMIFIIAVVIILAAGLYFSQNRIITQSSNIIAQNHPGPTGSTNLSGEESGDDDGGGVKNITIKNSPSNTAGATITTTDVARHNTYNDCWLIVGGKVYDVTNFLPMHSGGAGQIIPFCGKDATSAFATKNGRGSHRQGDLNILNNYYVGNLR